MREPKYKVGDLIITKCKKIRRIKEVVKCKHFRFIYKLVCLPEDQTNSWECTTDYIKLYIPSKLEKALL